MQAALRIYAEAHKDPQR